YLTIELKGSIPEDLRPQIGEWVFGCDVCQQVCPWNQRFADPSGEASLAGEQLFSPRAGVPRPDLIDEITISPEEFNQKFKKSPIKRAKRRGYLRSAAVVIANTTRKGDRRAEEALQRAALDPEPLIREHAAWAFEKITKPEQ
ncbi:MAG: tRNA epoxyqueuosine(34) reductase QueG, partial [Chloroflexi bacterium]